MNATLSHACHLALCIVAAACAIVVAAPKARPDDRSGEKQYEYRQDFDRWVAIVIGKQFLLGHLDANGNFLPDPTIKFYRVGQPFSGPGFVYLNKPTTPGEHVFEYRSNLLIEGTLDEDGTFVPKLGAPIIPFARYRYGKDSPRIYNLPGRFVEKKR